MNYTEINQVKIKKEVVKVLSFQFHQGETVSRWPPNLIRIEKNIPGQPVTGYEINPVTIGMTVTEFINKVNALNSM